MYSRCCVSLVLALAASACASSVETPFGEDFADRVAPERGNSRLIVRAELDELAGRTAWEAIERLHRRWLRPGRGGSITSGPIFARVVVDGAFPGELDELRRISTESIETLEYLSPADAITKYGTGYLGGVIEVRTRRGSP